MNQDKQDLAKTAVNQAKQAKRNIVDKAIETKEVAKVELLKTVDQQKDAATSQVRDIDQALRITAQSVGNPALERQITHLADRVGRAASTLEATEIDDVIASANEFSRANPVIFMTGSFALGLMAARFLRATSEQTRR